MRPSLRVRILAVSFAGSLLAGAIGLKWWSDSRERAHIEFFHSEVEAPAAAKARGSSMGRPIAPEHPEDWRYFLEPNVANRIFLIKAQQGVYDPWTYFRQQPNVVETQPWPERAAGKFILRTNDLGFREDAALPVPRPQLRVLVTGDSHTDGVCNNDESFANRLEANLCLRRAGKTVEVLNAGVGGFTLFHYFGMLLRESAFEPQVFVIAVYGGNDFAELLLLEHRFQATKAAQWPTADLQRRNEALLTAACAMGQCFNQVQTFLSMPEEKDVAIACALRLCAEMKEVCSKRGIAMVVVFIPAACSCAWPEPHPDIERGRTDLGLPAADGGVNAELALRFTGGVRALEIPLLDMREIFERQPVPPYWRTDLHLNFEGHRLIAEALEPVVLPLLDAATR